MANGTSDELWKGLLAVFAAGAVFSWAVFGVVWGVVQLAHHLRFIWK